MSAFSQPIDKEIKGIGYWKCFVTTVVVRGVTSRLCNRLFQQQRLASFVDGQIIVMMMIIIIGLSY